MVVVAVVVASVSVPLAYERFWPRGPSWGPSNSPIRHIVVLVMENHAYDNLFGTYCTVTGPYCPETSHGIPPGTCVPYNPANYSFGCIRPYPFTTANYSTPDLPHIFNSTVGDIDNGRMDGFYPWEQAGAEPFGYYNGTELPIAWDVAQEYSISDRFFSSALSYSLPNHWYLLAGRAPVVSVYQGFTKPTYRHEYLDQANATPTVQDLLNQSPSVSWKYYDWALPSYTTAINAAPGGISAYNNWNPMAARGESYSSWYVSHFVPRSDFFNDSAAGTLPALSWVIPDPSFSDHPPADLQWGESFIADVVDAVETSSEWNSTALFVVWDDFGGFYDDVPPPSIDPLGLSIRVPALVVSPYTPAGLVVHSLHYFESILRFMEWQFHLGCLTPRDCLAPMPWDFFQFNSTPRAPVLFPYNATGASYPYQSPVSAAGAFAEIRAMEISRGTSWDTGPPNPNLTATQVD